jgi:hypothetical protein
MKSPEDSPKRDETPKPDKSPRGKPPTPGNTPHKQPSPRNTPQKKSQTNTPKKSPKREEPKTPTPGKSKEVFKTPTPVKSPKPDRPGPLSSKKRRAEESIAAPPQEARQVSDVSVGDDVKVREDDGSTSNAHVWNILGDHIVCQGYEVDPKGGYYLDSAKKSHYHYHISNVVRKLKRTNWCTQKRRENYQVHFD